MHPVIWGLQKYNIFPKKKEYSIDFIFIRQFCQFSWSILIKPQSTQSLPHLCFGRKERDEHKVKSILIISLRTLLKIFANFAVNDFVFLNLKILN
jgi:hypothetical protein